MNNIIQVINWDIKNNSVLFFFKFLLVIGLFIFFSRYLTQTSLLSLILVLIIVYYLLSFTNNDYQNNINKEQKDNSIIDLNKYQYLQQQPDLLNIINNISTIINFNKTIFNSILFRLDNFLLIYNIYKGIEKSKSDINILNLSEKKNKKNINFISTNFYEDNRFNLVDNAVLFYESILNDLMSIYISIPLYNDIIDKKIENEYKSCFNQLKSILDVFIEEIKKINNLSNINCYSKIYTIDNPGIESPDPNPTEIDSFNFHWNLY